MGSGGAQLSPMSARSTSTSQRQFVRRAASNATPLPPHSAVSSVRTQPAGRKDACKRPCALDGDILHAVRLGFRVARRDGEQVVAGEVGGGEEGAAAEVPVAAAARAVADGDRAGQEVEPLSLIHI